MGYSYAHVIEQAAQFLLSELAEKMSVKYSTFYDGTEECHQRLKCGVGSKDHDCPEQLIDLAVIQLEGQGIVKTRSLKSKLADEECDYLIEWTDDGRSRLASGFTPQFQDME